MKKLTALLLIMAMLLSFTACQYSDHRDGSTEAEPTEVITEKDHVTSDSGYAVVQLANAYWGEDRIFLEIDWISKASCDGIFRSSYIIERKEGEAWVSCQTVDELTFVPMERVLSAGQTQRETYYISDMFDVSKAGTYRFRSEISIGDDDPQAVSTEFTLLSKHPEEDDIDTQESFDYTVQYIRTNGHLEHEDFLNVVILRSLDELNSYCERNSGFQDASNMYDAAYFEKSYLVLVVLETGSGSIRHEVTGCTVSSDGELYVYINSIIPEICTWDMAWWHIVLEMSNTVAVKGEDTVNVYLDGNLRYEKGSVMKLAPVTT